MKTLQQILEELKTKNLFDKLEFEIPEIIGIRR